MKTLMCSSLCLLIAALTPAKADVLIYRGVYRPYLPTLDMTDARAQKCYVVLGDVDASGAYEVVILHYGKRGGVKKVVQEEKRTAIVKTISANEKTYTALTFAEFFNGGLAFRSSAIFIRGENRTLALSNAPVVTRSMPRTMNGVFRESIISFVGGSDYHDADFSMTFDIQRTLAANNAEKTTDTAVTDLKGELNAMGFINE